MSQNPLPMVTNLRRVPRNPKEEPLTPPKKSRRPACDAAASPDHEASERAR